MTNHPSNPDQVEKHKMERAMSDEFSSIRSDRQQPKPSIKGPVAGLAAIMAMAAAFPVARSSFSVRVKRPKRRFASVYDAMRPAVAPRASRGLSKVDALAFAMQATAIAKNAKAPRSRKHCTNIKELRRRVRENLGTRAEKAASA